MKKSIKKFGSVILAGVIAVLISVAVLAQAETTDTVNDEDVTAEASSVISEEVSSISGSEAASEAEDVSETESVSEIVKHMLGDVNGDGIITAADARSALRISAELDVPSSDELIAADVDFDGRVTASDARTILRVSAGLEKITSNTVESSSADEAESVTSEI